MKTLVKPVIETRSMPTLLEQRNNLMTELETLIDTVKSETRALNDTEQSRFNQIKTEIGNIDKTVQAQQQAEQMKQTELKPATPEQKEQRALDEDKFRRFIRGEERALDVGSNG